MGIEHEYEYPYKDIDYLRKQIDTHVQNAVNEAITLIKQSNHMGAYDKILETHLFYERLVMMAAENLPYKNLDFLKE